MLSFNLIMDFQQGANENTWTWYVIAGVSLCVMILTAIKLRSRDKKGEFTYVVRKNGQMELVQKTSQARKMLDKSIAEAEAAAAAEAEAAAQAEEEAKMIEANKVAAGG